MVNVIQPLYNITITPEKNCTTYHYMEQHESTIDCIHGSWAPDDGRVTPETCRALLNIKSIKSCILLVIYMIFINKDARSHEHKKKLFINFTLHFLYKWIRNKQKPVDYNKKLAFFTVCRRILCPVSGTKLHAWATVTTSNTVSQTIHALEQVTVLWHVTE